MRLPVALCTIRAPHASLRLKPEATPDLFTGRLIQTRLKAQTQSNGV
jgi:hypothetical protein